MFQMSNNSWLLFFLFTNLTCSSHSIKKPFLIHINNSECLTNLDSCKIIVTSYYDYKYDSNKNSIYLKDLNINNSFSISKFVTHDSFGIENVKYSSILRINKQLRCQRVQILIDTRNGIPVLYIKGRNNKDSTFLTPDHLELTLD